MQKTAYEMRISDWSSDVCSSDLLDAADRAGVDRAAELLRHHDRALAHLRRQPAGQVPHHGRPHAPGRLLPGFHRGAELDPPADALQRPRHPAFPPAGVTHLRVVRTRRPCFYIAAPMPARILVLHAP